MPTDNVPTSDEKSFWDEDAERLNRMCEIAREQGAVVDVKAITPPLNKDGSLKQRNGAFKKE